MLCVGFVCLEEVRLNKMIRAARKVYEQCQHIVSLCRFAISICLLLILKARFPKTAIGCFKIFVKNN